MTKWCKEVNPVAEQWEQYAISDELAALWRSNGNENISDEPWPDIPVVQCLLGIAEQGPSFREIKQEIKNGPSV
jgi:hypothetical protein